MVRCRNQELVRACPCGGSSTGGNLAVLQQSGGQGRSIPRALCLLFEGRCTLSLAAEEPGQAGVLGTVCPEQPKPAVASECPSFPSRAVGRYPRHAKKVTELEAGTVHRIVLRLRAPSVSVWKQEVLSPHFPLLWASSCSHLAPATLFRHH